MRIVIAVLAENASVSQNGNLNVFGIFDNIAASSFPAVHARATLVIGFRFTLAEVGQPCRVELKFMDEDHVLATVTGEFVVPARPDQSVGEVGLNQIFNVNQLILPKAGRYSFRVLVNGREEAEIPFGAVLVTPGTSG